MVGFSHSKRNIYYNFCVPKYTANRFQKPVWPYFYYWPRHLTLKMFVIFLCPPKSPEYFWLFIFQEDVIDSSWGISICSLVPAATLQLSLYRRWETCGGEGKRVPFPQARGEDGILSSLVLRRHLLRYSPSAAHCHLHSHTCLLLVTPTERHQCQPSPSGFLNLFFFFFFCLVYLS